MRCRACRPWPSSCRDEATARFGIGVPKATSAEIVDKLNAAINAGFTDCNSRRVWLISAACQRRCSPADFAKQVADETEKWAKVAQSGEHQAGVIRELGRIFRTSVIGIVHTA